MFEIAPALLDRFGAGRRIAVATVTAVRGSAPRDLGTSMALDDDGDVLGSISGGCVGGAVVEIAERVLATGRPETAVFGISEAQAFAVGLECGGEIDVLVRELRAGGAEHPALASARAGRAAGSAVLLVGPVELVGSSVDELTDPVLASAGVGGLSAARLASTADARIREGFTGRVPVQCENAELELFVESRLSHPRMLIAGATDFARALSDAAALLGYSVTIVDPRAAFATRTRFPAAREVLVGWPDEALDTLASELDERSVIAVLTHGDGDVELLTRALALPVGYVGAMGSRRTHERRSAALTAAGVPSELRARLHSPIGLDLGAATPEETAVSVLAEIIAERSQRAGQPLRDTAGPIHAR